jgi:hypothetical protein
LLSFFDLITFGHSQKRLALHFIEVVICSHSLT